MCMTSSIPNSIVMKITSHYPKLRYIRNAEVFCKEFFKQSYKSFLNPETLDKLSAVAAGFTWQQAMAEEVGMPTMDEVIAAFAKRAC